MPTLEKAAASQKYLYSRYRKEANPDLETRALARAFTEYPAWVPIVLAEPPFDAQSGAPLHPGPERPPAYTVLGSP